MKDRWQYAQGSHPAFCACIECVEARPTNESERSKHSLSDVLDRWRRRRFDPHYILGLPPNSSSKLINEAHRRWIVAYHPDKHNNDPLATELTKHINAARDALLGKNQRTSNSQREQQRKQDEARRQGFREAERMKRDGARQRTSERRTAQHGRRNRRTDSLFWPLLTVALAALIATHLFLAIESPDGVDNMMQNWAQLFDKSLARQ